MMKISNELQKFIEKNITLIEKNTKESWEKIYSMNPPPGLAELFITKIGIDPAEFMENIPNYYLDDSSIEEYEIPDHVTVIGNASFNGCNNLISITIPNGVISISDNAFRKCSNLTSIVMSDSVTRIGESAFYDCKSLKSIYIRDIAAWCNISFGGNDFANPFYYAGNLYLNNELVTELIIPNTVTKINDAAFRYCSSLTSIIIPDSVTSIGEFAFRHCSSLTSITIPDSVTSIGDWAFGGCNRLTEINFKGTRQDALTRLEVRNKEWRGGSIIQKIVCTDGVIDL